MTRTENLNIVDVLPITSPKKLKDLLPVTDSVIETVLNARKAIKSILEGEDSRILMIVGPCSIHDPQAALEYAECLKKLADEVSETVLVVMRVYFEKPRTTVGWKGLINDPPLAQILPQTTTEYRQTNTHKHIHTTQTQRRL